MGGESLIDTRQIDTICEECGEEIIEILNDFVAEFPAYYAKLQQSVAGADLAAVGRTAHLIKGSCATFGMVRLAALLSEMELSAVGGKIPAEEELPKMKRIFEESVRQLRRHHPPFGADDAPNPSPI